MRAWLPWTVSTLIACTAIACTRGPAPAGAVQGAPPDGPRSFVGEMHAQAFATREARDALVRGDTDTARNRLAFLAAQRLDDRLPDELRPFAQGMVAAAATGRDAADLGGLSRAVAETTGWCGQCHLAAEVSLPFRPPPLDMDDDTPSHMQRHAWALERFWEGVVGPDPEMWRLGAAALYEAPVHGDATGHDPAAEALADLVHQLGDAAAIVQAWDDRVEISATIVTACATCHRVTRGGPPP